METGAIEGNRAVSDEFCTGTRIESVLSAQQGRVLRALLEERSIPADPILCKGETLDYEEYLTVCYELHHVLLPELSDMKFVEFDRFEDEVRRGMEFNEVRRFPAQIDDDYSVLAHKSIDP